MAPAKSSVLWGTLRDVTRTKVELLAENALLRQQLAILQRQVNCPQLTRRDRFWLLAWASRVAHWTQALVIIQPDTLLRWHRAGLRLFWKHISKPKSPQPKIPSATIALIKQMARENLVWGAARIHRKRSLQRVGSNSRFTSRKPRFNVTCAARVRRRNPLQLGRPF